MWTFLAVASFTVFVGGVFTLTRRAFDAQGHFQRAARPLLAAIVAAFFVWIFALCRVPPPYPVEKTRFYIPPALEVNSYSENALFLLDFERECLLFLLLASGVGPRRACSDCRACANSGD